MAVHIASDETFDELIAEGVSIVDFFSTHCGPCRALLPTLMEIEAELPFINLVKINTDDCPQLADRFMISTLPTIYLAKDGVMTEYKGLLEFEPLSEAVAALLYE